MRILPAVEEEIRRVVRDERARDPLITVAGLEKALEKHFEGGFSHQYVSKIADKVAREALVVADRTQIEQRMNFTRENYRMMREALLKIVYWNRDTAACLPYACLRERDSRLSGRLRRSALRACTRTSRQ